MSGGLKGGGLVLAPLLLALVAPVTLAEEVKEKEPLIALHVSGLGGMLKGEGVVGSNIFYHFSHKAFRLTLGLPLIFAPRNGIRKEDWDERTDFGRVVGEVSFESPSKGLSFSLSPLLGHTLGVGNLVSLFYSTMDRDHWRTSFLGSYRGPLAGIDLLLDSFLDPLVIGGRLYLRPFYALQPSGLFGRFEFGVSIVGDVSAPKDYFFRQGSREVLSSGLPRTDNEGLLGLSADLRWPIIRSKEVEATPYFAFSTLSQKGGIHAGLSVDLSPSQGLRFVLLGEFRRLGEGYVAGYFDSLYSIDRYDFDGIVPKARALSLHASGPRYGFGTGLALYLKNVFSLWFALDLDRASIFTNLRLGTQLSLSKNLVLTATLLERGLHSPKDLFDPDRFVLATSLDFRLSRLFSLFATYTHDLTSAKDGEKRGRYLPTDSALLGLRLSLGNR